MEQGELELKQEVVQVSKRTATKGLCRFILKALTQEKRDGLTLRGIGAGSVNQISKAIAGANLTVNNKGMRIDTHIAFKFVDGDDKENITALEYTLKLIENE